MARITKLLERSTGAVLLADKFFEDTIKKSHREKINSLIDKYDRTNKNLLDERVDFENRLDDMWRKEFSLIGEWRY